MIKAKFDKLNKLFNHWQNDDGTKLLAVIVGFISISIVFVAIACMLMGKPIADDFGAIVSSRPDNWLNGINQSIQSNGRYGQSIAGAIFYGLFQKQVGILLPILLTVWLGIIIYLILKKLFKKLDLKNDSLKLLSIFGAILVISLLLFVNYADMRIIDVGRSQTWFSFQFFFWPSGAITYLLPIIILLNAIYLFFIRTSKLSATTRYILFSLMLVASGLFNETLPASLIVISSTFLIVSLLKPFKQKLSRFRPISLVMAIVPLLSLLIIYLSDGNQSRQAVLGISKRDIFKVLIGSVKTGLNSINIYFKPEDILLFIVIGLLIASLIIRFNRRYDLKDLKTNLLLIGIGSAIATVEVIICASLLVAYGYGEWAGVITRTLVLTQFLYIIGCLCLAVWLGLYIQKNNKLATSAILSIILIVAMPFYFVKIRQQAISSARYFISWRSQEKIIKEFKQINPNETIYLPNEVSGIGITQELSCNNGWLHEHIEKYFDLKRACSFEDAKN